MTKKDGVDVNECDFFIKNRDKYLCRCTKINSFGDIVTPKNAENSNCLDNYNCYYKQLARKAQECEELKEKYEALKLENQEGYEIVDELKQECEELKRKVKLMMDCLDCKVDEYKEALDEIEEICRQLLDDDYIRSVAESLIDIISRAKGD